MSAANIVNQKQIADRIFFIRGHKVMLDMDLAQLYGVLTKNLNKAVTRNIDRFPQDFMFQLTDDEFENLRSILEPQIEIAIYCGQHFSMDRLIDYSPI